MAVYEITPPALLEIQVLGRLHGQRIRNVFHYNYRVATDLPDGRATALLLAEQFMSQKWSAIMPVLSEEYVVESITAQWVVPTRFRQVTWNVSEAGAYVGSSLPTMCAGVLSLVGVLASPSAFGRKYIAGIPVAYEDDSELDPDFQQGLDDLGTALTSALTIPATSVTLQLTTQTPETWTGTGLYDVVEHIVRPVIRTQRRRQVGVGE